MGHYIVMTSAAKMPQCCWGRYRNVAVVEVEDINVRPTMISMRALNVIRIVKHFGPQSVGKTKACAYERTLVEAYRMADAMNDFHMHKEQRDMEARCLALHPEDMTPELQAQKDAELKTYLHI